MVVYECKVRVQAEMLEQVQCFFKEMCGFVESSSVVVMEGFELSPVNSNPHFMEALLNDPTTGKG